MGKDSKKYRFEARLELVKATARCDDVLERAGVEGSGEWWSCPFHDEHSPSLHIFDSAHRFNCFGCGEKGDALDLTQKLYTVNFNEALHMLSKGISHAGWAEVRLQRLQAAVDTPKGKGTHLKTVRLLWAVQGRNAYILRREGADADILREMLEDGDRYLDQAEGAQHGVPLGAYAGSVRIAKSVNRFTLGIEDPEE